MLNRRILFSQTKPADENSSYYKIAEKFDLDISFVPFISPEAVEAREFRMQKINILEHTAVLLTSRNTVDHFFRICQELRIPVPETMKYFCLTEVVANYLQKYILPKKRKIFVGEKNLNDLFNQIRKHPEDKYLIVCSQNRKIEIVEFFKGRNIEYTEATFFTITVNDLSQLNLKEFGIIVFFTPADVTSLFQNFPGYKQNKTMIACFGPATISMAKQFGLTVNIEAPIAEALSMIEAIELYLNKTIR
jgi:uroporphyrinogen-III synthase